MSRFLKSIVWNAPGAASVTFTRNVASVRFEPPSTYKKSGDKKEEMVEKVKEYCKETGIDDLGADKAVVSGPAHMPQRTDDRDPWERLTVEIRDSDNRKMRLKDSTGETYDRIHIATDRRNWHQKGYFQKA